MSDQQQPRLYFSERKLWDRAERDGDLLVLEVLCRLSRWRDRARGLEQGPGGAREETNRPQTAHEHAA